MSFEEKFHPKIKHDLKALDKSVVNSIKTIHLDKILKDPYSNDRLKGKLSALYSYHFSQNSVAYRIAYKIENDTIIFYYMMSKRENFYKNLQKRIGH